MKWIHDISCALALALAITTAAVAQDKPGVVVTDEVEAIATVDAVDYAARTVTLRGPKGNVVTIKVPDEAQNLDQVQVGDKVRVRYLESVALFVSGERGEPGAEQFDKVKLAPKGAPAGGVAASVTEIRAKVEGIHYLNRWVDLRGPEGRLVRVNVPESVTRFNEMKVGDLVVVRLTEAIGLSLQKQ